MSRHGRGLRPFAASWDLPGARVPSRRSGAVIRIAQLLLRPALALLTRPRWAGTANLPSEGAAIICGNHTGPLDALAYGHVLQTNGIAPRFLAKDSLFRIPLLGALLRATGQIPVIRSRGATAAALDAARAALGRGEALIVFPEGTYTRDPQAWPMRARLGAARLALATGAPLVPIACWGSRDLWPVGALLPRPGGGRRIMMVVGEPIHAERAAGESEREAEIRVTNQLMRTITELLAQLRGDDPPARVHDPRGDAIHPEDGGPGARFRFRARPWRVDEGPWHISRARRGRNSRGRDSVRDSDNSRGRNDTRGRSGR